MRIGIDVGGTFTDVVLIDDRTGLFHYAKTPTTHFDLAEGVLNGLRDILNIANISMDQVDYIIHGTTIGTNAIVEGKGARIGLITTAGFEDVLEIRRVARPKEAAFDFGADNPPPLVPRYLRKGVRERIDSKGCVVVPLEEKDVEQVCAFFKEQQIEAVVVSFLFSFLNPLHEKRVAEIVGDLLPGIPVSLSSEICPEFREYERTCTTVMNGYLGPVIRDYMDNLTARLSREFGEVTLHIMQSNGGTMTAEVAKDHASHLINSGPAGGAIAAAFVSRLTGSAMAVGADMGGTTFDISIIDQNLPKTTTWGGVTNYPIKLPMVDLKTIGAGGGSIAWVDEGGVLNVGPQSAGSDPGPAGYGWGGTLPTVSDANLVLGRLNPDYFLGGKLPLYPEKARAAIEEHVAKPMNLSVEEAAAGIIRIVNANMAKGISGNSVERGYDLREFALITMGGAAALHAAEIAKELSMARVIVPAMSGNFSAVGMVVADIQHDYVRTYAKKHWNIHPEDLLARFKEMEEEGMKQLREEKVPEDRIEITWSADLRYEGQSWELNTPIPVNHALKTGDILKIVEDFHALHQRVYSYSEPEETVEFINLRVRVKGLNPPIAMEAEYPEDTGFTGEPKALRPVYFEGAGWQEIPIYERDLLPVGSRVPGPCIIEERISTALIPQGFTGSIDSFRNIIMVQEHWEQTNIGGRNAP
ncbi:MAG: hydantoinase/oxoprolinase family protein [Deltaproteobacteria bacterium]|nr:hydantoinase/oxoprolinase family protein [Deltaproteobacteria bacterium]MBW2128957.1 hydantoinase/oxoprolinase family protein [Deltaproteobacteria bacterium]MBW2302761.1 hydantoinase/oxoprolinase family protein [Deltaproteobacteria bacterium]